MNNTETPNTKICKIIKTILHAENLESFQFITPPENIDQEEIEWYETAINGQALSYLYPRKLQIIKQMKNNICTNLDTCIKYTEEFLEYWNRESVYVALNFMNIHASDSFFAATNVLVEASKHGLRQGDPYSIW